MTPKSPFLARKVIKDQLRVRVERKGGKKGVYREILYHLVIFTASTNLRRFPRGYEGISGKARGRPAIECTTGVRKVSRKNWKRRDDKAPARTLVVSDTAMTSSFRWFSLQKLRRIIILTRDTSLLRIIIEREKVITRVSRNYPKTFRDAWKKYSPRTNLRYRSLLPRRRSENFNQRSLRALYLFDATCFHQRQQIVIRSSGAFAKLSASRSG